MQITSIKQVRDQWYHVYFSDGTNNYRDVLVSLKEEVEQYAIIDIHKWNFAASAKTNSQRWMYVTEVAGIEAGSELIGAPNYLTEYPVLVTTVPSAGLYFFDQ